MLNKIKKQVYDANIALWKSGLVIFTWGNVSERFEDFIIIKPSGVEYEKMKPKDMVIVDLNGNIVDGKLKPSSDTPTHIELYKEFPNIKGICHTHSSYATSFAQAGEGLKPYGTTHADYFYGEIPCTRELTQQETENDYEKNTGKVIIETFRNTDIKSVPGVLVKHHGVFSWGFSAKDSVHNAIVMEEVAKMNYRTLILNPQASTLMQYTLDKHYNRKHGKNAYYGQK